MSTVSAGVIMARYFKPDWPERNILGQKVWFQVGACFLKWGFQNIFKCESSSRLFVSTVTQTANDPHSSAHLGWLCFALHVQRRLEQGNTHKHTHTREYYSCFNSVSYFHHLHHTSLTVQQRCQCVRPTCCLLRITKSQWMSRVHQKRPTMWNLFGRFW